MKELNLFEINHVAGAGEEQDNANANTTTSYLNTASCYLNSAIDNINSINLTQTQDLGAALLGIAVTKAKGALFGTLSVIAAGAAMHFYNDYTKKN